MTPLAEIADSSRPNGSSVVLGIVAGIASQGFTMLHTVAGLIADIGAICSGVIAIYAGYRFACARRREWLQAIAERRAIERRDRELRDDYPHMGGE